MTPQPSEQPRTAYPSMRYRLAAALHMAANLPEYNLSHRMMSVHGGPGDMSYLDAADMILGTQPMLDYAYEAAAPDPVADPDEAVRLLRAVLDTEYTLQVGGHDVECDMIAGRNPDANCSCGKTAALDEAHRYLAATEEGTP